jgi:ribonucleoside-diphosphate reductase alpha chain
MQERQGIQQDLLGGAGAPAVPAREVVAGAAGELVVPGRELDQQFLGACPDCGSQLAYAEGCAKCHVCGYSECE